MQSIVHCTSTVHSVYRVVLDICRFFVCVVIELVWYSEYGYGYDRDLLTLDMQV